MKSEEPTTSTPERLKLQGIISKSLSMPRKSCPVLRPGPAGNTQVRAAFWWGPTYEISSTLKKPGWTVELEGVEPISISKLSLRPVVPAGTRSVSCFFWCSNINLMMTWLGAPSARSRKLTSHFEIVDRRREFGICAVSRCHDRGPRTLGAVAWRFRGFGRSTKSVHG